MSGPQLRKIACFALIALGFWGLEGEARRVPAAKDEKSESKDGKAAVKDEKSTAKDAKGSAKAKPATYESALSGNNYLASKRVLQDVVRANRPKDAAAAAEWSRSLLALVSLERLIGDETEARTQFARCDSLCPEQVSAEEWRSIKEWACNGTKTPVAACKLRKK